MASTKKKNINPFLAVTIIVLTFVVILLLIAPQKRNLPTTQKTGVQKTTGVAAIQNAEDLNKTSSELDNTDLNEIDRGLTQLDSDASSF